MIPEIPADELIAIIDGEIAAAQERMDAYDERAAMQVIEDGKTTDQRAIEALKRPERFNGEHLVARMWLQCSSTARCWGRNGAQR